MCRICGRMVKCIFDSMPSRTTRVINTRTFSSTRPCPYLPSRRESSRQLSRTVPDRKSHPSRLPSLTLPLPFRAKLHQAARHQSASPASQFHNTQPEIPPSMLQTSEPSSTIISTITQSSQEPSDVRKPLVLSKSVQQLLPALSSQTPHYITAHIHRFPYLLTAGDTLRLPFHLHGVSPGDVLRFNRASLLGSRDYTLKAGKNSSELYDRKRTGEPNYLDERLFECRVRVLGVDSQPMTIKEKTKRRNRRVKRVMSKHRYTVLKVMEVKVRTLEELQGLEGERLLLE